MGYNYVIVGAGSAGCALAARLSEDEMATVLLIEAGPADTNPYIHLPVGFYTMTSGGLTWGYKTAPQRHAGNREIPYAQARVLGGGSSINAQVFTRGCPEDYDHWANDLGCAGWSFEEVLPYFVRMEDNDTFGGAYHGIGGPLGVSSLNPQPLTRAFVQACQQTGMPFNPDFNGAAQAGANAYQVTNRGARRCSAAVGYLRPALKRRNLSLEKKATVLRIVVEHGRAVGVECEREGKRIVVNADEVIVTAGAIGSPKLMLLSGIGPADELRRHGIDVVADLPGVGRNLHDHFGVDVVHELKGAFSLDRYAKPHWKMWAGLEYLLFRKGPVASTIVEGGAFWYADKDASTPDLQFHFLVGAGVEEGVASIPPGSSGSTLNSYTLRPRSRGSVSLRSANPADAPIIDPNFLDHPYDLRISIEGVRQSREIMRQPALGRYVRKEHFPGDAVKTDADLEAYIRQYGRTSYHPVGTCKMGTDATAVVDSELRVHGIGNLRICDSSVMPQLISSNTNAPTLMIAEKAADLIRGNCAPSQNLQRVA